MEDGDAAYFDDVGAAGGDSEGTTGNSTGDGNHRTPGHAEPHDQEYGKYSDCSNRDSLEKGKEKET
jgi:hypothetical protein